MVINQLTSAEEQLMHLFWDLETFYLKDVMEKHPEPKPHQNTVSTYLKILVEKGFLQTEKEGRIYKYSLLVGRNDYRNFLMKNLINDYFENAESEIISLLMKENVISQEKLLDVMDIKIGIRTEEDKAPEYKIADEILKDKKPKKEKNKKEKKKKKKKK